MSEVSRKPGYRGAKGDLFRRLSAGDVVRAPSRERGAVADDEDLFIHWRTFYRYIADFCRDGYPVRRDSRVGGYVMVYSSSDPDDNLVDVMLTSSQAMLLLEIVREYGGDVGLSRRSPLGAIHEALSAAVYGDESYF